MVDITVTLEQRSKIRKDWSDTLINCMLDSEYIELTGNELEFWEKRDPVFLAKFRSDVKEFLTTIVDLRLAQAEVLLNDDPEYFSYIKDDFVDFASYGGTECRMIYRTFFALKGYDSFAYCLDSDNLDGYGIGFYKELYDKVLAAV